MIILASSIRNFMPQRIFPILGYGTWDIRGKDGLKAIENALEVGYRNID